MRSPVELRAAVCVYERRSLNSESENISEKLGVCEEPASAPDPDYTTAPPPENPHRTRIHYRVMLSLAPVPVLTVRLVRKLRKITKRLELLFLS